MKVEPPREELAALSAAAPPMTGGEYLTPADMEALWSRIEAAFQDELAAWDGTVEAFLRQKSPLWNLVGRVCFHLAENKGDEDAPFAFVATYTTRLGARAKAQHVPLGQALSQYAGARNKAALLALLAPVQRAARTSAVAKELVDSGAVFEALAWTPAEAHRFLTDVPIFEASGVVVRIPASWHAKRPPRPEVQVTIGKRQASTLGADAMLDFSIAVTLDGETLTPSARCGRSSPRTDGLALVRGRWVEIDREKLGQVLDHWKAFEAAQRLRRRLVRRRIALARRGAHRHRRRGARLGGRGGVVDGRRGRVAGASSGGPAQSRKACRAVDPVRRSAPSCVPIRRSGCGGSGGLRSLGLGGCLADDMGLGKTIQVIALARRCCKKQGARERRPACWSCRRR